MKKVKPLYLYVLAIAIIIISMVLYRSNQVVIFYVGMCISIVLMIFGSRLELKQRKEAEKKASQDYLETKKDFEEVVTKKKDLCNTLSVIYSLYNHEIETIEELVSKTGAYYDYNYDKDKNELTVAFSFQNGREVNSCGLIYDNTNQYLVIRNNKKDISELEKEDIIDELYKAIMLFAKDEILKDSYDFKSQNPKVAFIVFLVFGLLGLAVTILLPILAYNKVVNEYGYYASIIPFFVACVNFSGVYAYLNGSIKLEGEVLTVKKFMKTYKFNVNEISKIDVDFVGGSNPKLYFYKNNEFVCKLTDPFGSLFRTGDFKRMVNHYHIPFNVM